MTSAVKKPAKKRGRSLERKKARAGWIFTMPFLIGFILIYLAVLLLFIFKAGKKKGDQTDPS